MSSISAGDQGVPFPWRVAYAGQTEKEDFFLKKDWTVLLCQSALRRIKGIVKINLSITSKKELENT